MNTPTCRKCGGNMRKGQAILPYIVTKPRGHTVYQTSRPGPAPLKDVVKCEECGHSFTA